MCFYNSCSHLQFISCSSAAPHPNGSWSSKPVRRIDRGRTLNCSWGDTPAAGHSGCMSRVEPCRLAGNTMGTTGHPQGWTTINCSWQGKSPVLERQTRQIATFCLPEGIPGTFIRYSTSSITILYNHITIHHHNGGPKKESVELSILRQWPNPY